MRLERVNVRVADAYVDTDVCYLVENTWDDFTFKTLFEAILFDSRSVRHNLGYVRILREGMGSGRVVFEQETESLDTQYCSLGSSREYYENLYHCPAGTRMAYLTAIRDAAFNPDIFTAFENEVGMQKSLLRDVTKRDATVTFPRILRGDAKLSRYQFEYRFAESGEPTERLAFRVEPLSKPPTNIHVLIGRNGVGKTRLLAGMADAVTENRAASIGLAGNLVFTTDFEEVDSEFLNLIVVSYSAFDKFDPIPSGGRTEKGIPNYYIGIKARSVDALGQGLESSELVHLKTSNEMTREFSDSIRLVAGDPNKLERWLRAIRTLGSDPTINDMQLSTMIDENDADSSSALVSLFSTLSSGHKVVMLTITRLVELVSDRSLVLMDEPETHLHPPLLASFVRALSDLLHSRNAVAIVATHSPVVLQEVPSECVQVVVRSGNTVRALAPDIETFGENVGTLTRKIFGLEVENSGFYRLLADEADGGDFDDVMERFSRRVGSEGRALVRSLTRGS